MIKIYLSPSVQEKNIGVGTYGTEEQKMNMLSNELEIMLLESGYEVFRNYPTMTLKEVVAESNRVVPVLHLALHSNASKDGSARGLEIFCNTKNADGAKLSNSIYGYLSPLTPTEDRGIKDGTHLFEIAYTNATALLIEVGFHDNKDDARFINDNLKLIANAIFNGMNDFYGVKPKVDYKEKYENLQKDLKVLIKIYEGR